MPRRIVQERAQDVRVEHDVDRVPLSGAQRWTDAQSAADAAGHLGDDGATCLPRPAGAAAAPRPRPQPRLAAASAAGGRRDSNLPSAAGRRRSRDVSTPLGIERDAIRGEIAPG